MWLPIAPLLVTAQITPKNATLVYYYYSPRPYSLRGETNPWIDVLAGVSISQSLDWMLVSIDGDGDRILYPRATLVGNVSKIDAIHGKDGSVIKFEGPADGDAWSSALRRVLYRAPDKYTFKDRPNEHVKTITVMAVDAQGNTGFATRTIVVKTARTTISDRTPITIER